LDAITSNSLTAHKVSSSTIYDVLYANNDTIALVTMSGQLLLIDLRQGCARPSVDRCVPRSFGSLRCVSTHPHKNNLFAVGSESGHVMLWDLRKNSSNTNNNNNNNNNNLLESKMHNNCSKSYCQISKKHDAHIHKKEILQENEDPLPR